MEQSQLEDVLGELEAILEQLGYAPIVEQERRAAEGGRVVETTKEDRTRASVPSAMRPEVGDVRRAPLTPEERIAMLIDLVEGAVGGTFAIEEKVLNFALANFPVAAEEGRTPTFRPDAAEGFAVADDRQWSLPNRGELESRRQSVRQVLFDLEQLREAVGVRRDPTLLPEHDDPDTAADQSVLGWA